MADVLDAVAVIPGAGTIASVGKFVLDIPVIGSIFASSDPEKDKHRDAASEKAFLLAFQQGDSWAGLYLRQRARKRDNGEGDSLRIPIDPAWDFTKDDGDGANDGIVSMGAWGSDHAVAYAAKRYDQFKAGRTEVWQRVQELKDAIRAGKPASAFPSRYVSASPAVEIAKAGLPWLLGIGLVIGFLMMKREA